MHMYAYVYVHMYIVEAETYFQQCLSLVITAWA